MFCLKLIWWYAIRYATILLKKLYLMKETKKQKIKEWLLSGKPLTALMAAQLFGCTNLSAIILQLRKEGVQIDTETVLTQNGSHFGRYVISK